MGMRDRPYNAVTRVVRRASQLSGARNTFTSFANSFCALWPPSLPPSPHPNLDFIGSVSQTMCEFTWLSSAPSQTRLLFTAKRIPYRESPVEVNFCFILGGLAWSNLGRIDWFNLIETFERLLDRIDSLFTTWSIHDNV